MELIIHGRVVFMRSILYTTDAQRHGVIQV